MPRKSSIVIIPIKQYSERVPGKNFVNIQHKVWGKQPLYKLFTLTLVHSRLFDVVVDTDSNEIKQWCRSYTHSAVKMGVGGNDITVIDRAPGMADDSANGNTLLRYHVNRFPGYDMYWQAFVTAPFISSSSVHEMHRILRTEYHYDSIMSVKAHKCAMWLPNGVPINSRPDVMRRSQDLPPVYQEICGLFGITKEGFDRTYNRAGEMPYFYELPSYECVDIDWQHDIPGSIPSV